MFSIQITQSRVHGILECMEIQQKPYWTSAASTAAAAASLQSCPTVCDPIDGSPRGSAVRRILQARTLEWAAISFFNAWQWKVKVKSVSRVWLLATPWTAAYQAPPPMGSSRQEYWSGLITPQTTRYEKREEKRKYNEEKIKTDPELCRW